MSFLRIMYLFHHHKTINSDFEILYCSNQRVYHFYPRVYIQSFSLGLEIIRAYFVYFLIYLFFPILLFNHNHQHCQTCYYHTYPKAYTSVLCVCSVPEIISSGGTTRAFARSSGAMYWSFPLGRHAWLALSKKESKYLFTNDFDHLIIFSTAIQFS